MTEEKRYKVLVVGPSSQHVANYVDRISNDIFDIEIITSALGSLPEGTSFTKVDFSLKHPKSFFGTPAIIRQRTQEFQPDIIHVHQANSVAYYTLRGAAGSKIPIVLSAWGSDILINPKKSKVLRWMVRYILKRVDLITSNSHHMAAQVQNLLPERNLDIEICNFGVAELDVDTSKEKIVYSNRAHEPLYRIDKVISAFHQFVSSREDGREWQLIVAGKGSQTENLKAQVNALELKNQVRFIGFVDTRKNIENYAKAKVYISLPESDAAAVSLMESMYYRCLPVAYNLPASREHLTDGENGILVDDLNENMIARVLELDSEDLLTRNHAHIRDEQTVKVSRKRFKEVLLRGLASR
ncbi:MAG: hypothetical protein Crog4KO_11010 [Crocinitomicaceae bacterium]